MPLVRHVVAERYGPEQRACDQRGNDVTDQWHTSALYWVGVEYRLRSLRRPANTSCAEPDPPPDMRLGRARLFPGYHSRRTGNVKQREKADTPGLTSHRTPRIRPAGTRCPRIPARRGCRSWTCSTPARPPA